MEWSEQGEFATRERIEDHLGCVKPASFSRGGLSGQALRVDAEPAAGALCQIMGSRRGRHVPPRDGIGNVGLVMSPTWGRVARTSKRVLATQHSSLLPRYVVTLGNHLGQVLVALLVLSGDQPERTRRQLERHCRFRYWSARPRRSTRCRCPACAISPVFSTTRCTGPEPGRGNTSGVSARRLGIV